MKVRKYRFLTSNFFNSSVKIQINSVYRDKDVKIEKIIEFRRTLRNGDCVIDLDKLTKHQIDKIVVLGVFGVLLEIREKNKIKGEEGLKIC